MRHRASAALALLLPLSQAAAQTGFMFSDAQRQNRFAHMHEGDRSAAAGAYLCGRFAMSQNNYAVAALQYLVALQADPRSPELARQALIANALDGRPIATLIARQVVRTEPGYPVAQLVLAGQEASLGRWQAAAQHYAAMDAGGVFGLLRQALLAWAQFGAGRKDSMRALLQPLGGNGQVGGAYLYQAGLMADLDKRPEDAERFYLAAEADLGPTDFSLARALASLQARLGQPAQAAKTLAAAKLPGIALQASAPRLQADMAQLPVRDPGDGIAGIYVDFATLARQHGSSELSDLLFRLSLDLRPNLTSARLQLATALATEHRTPAALAMLSPIDPADPLAPSADQLRAKFLAAINNK